MFKYQNNQFYSENYCKIISKRKQEIATNIYSLINKYIKNDDSLNPMENIYFAIKH